MAHSKVWIDTENAPAFLVELHPGEIRALGGDVVDIYAWFDQYGFKPYRINEVAYHNQETHNWLVFSRTKLKPDTFIQHTQNKADIPAQSIYRGHSEIVTNDRKTGINSSNDDETD